MTVTVKPGKAANLFQTVRDLTKREVLVGIPAENAARSDGSSLNNAALGYILETGAPERNLPARPWLTTGVESVEEPLASLMGKAAAAAVSGDPGRVDALLHAAGMVAEKGVQTKISQGPFAPLSERTLKRRRKRGRVSTKPLIDTGELRRSVRYVIRNRSPR